MAWLVFVIVEIAKCVEIKFCMHLQDTGISVRKRVIKILRDICLEQPTFSKITEMCVRMIRRVNDEEGIKVWIHHASVSVLHLAVFKIKLRVKT